MSQDLPLNYQILVPSCPLADQSIDDLLDQGDLDVKKVLFYDESIEFYLLINDELHGGDYSDIRLFIDICDSNDNSKNLKSFNLGEEHQVGSSKAAVKCWKFKISVPSPSQIQQLRAMALNGNGSSTKQQQHQQQQDDNNLFISGGSIKFPNYSSPQQPRLKFQLIQDKQIDGPSLSTSIQRKEEILDDFKPVFKMQLFNKDLLKHSTSERPKHVVSAIPAHTSNTSSKLLLFKQLLIYPIFRMNLKHSKLQSYGKFMFVTLEISSSSYLIKNKSINDDIQIDRVDFELVHTGDEKDGRLIENVGNIKFPLSFNKNHIINLTYRVKLNNNSNNNNNSSGLQVKPVKISINTSLSDDSKVEINWVTNIDFNPSRSSSAISTPVIPPPSPASPIASNYRKTSELKNSLKMNRLSSTSIPSSSSLVKLNGTANTANLASKNLKISFTGLNQRVKIGEKFKWKITVINQSNDKTYDLILFIQSSIQHQFEKKMPPLPTSNASSNGNTSGNYNLLNNFTSITYNSNQLRKSLYSSNTNLSNDINNMNIEDPIPIIPLNALSKSYKQQINNLANNNQGIILLSNYKKLGKLNPQSVINNEIELICIELGLKNLNDLKIMDCISGELFECKKLFDVLVVA